MVIQHALQKTGPALRMRVVLVMITMALTHRSLGHGVMLMPLVLR